MFDVKKKAQELNDQIIRWRRTHHANPEVGFNTAATEKLIVEELEKMGADEIRHGNGMRGIVALIKGKKPGKVLGIRADYEFDETCQGSVPQAVVAFLEGEDFEDVIRNAVSIGGDSDTIAAIAGSIAEPYFGIPARLKARALNILDPLLKRALGITD